MRKSGETPSRLNCRWPPGSCTPHDSPPVAQAPGWHQPEAFSVLARHFARPGLRRRHQDKPSHGCSISRDDFQMQIQRIYEQEGICHAPHPGSPRANGKDLPFKYCKAIQEEDVCRVKLLCKQSSDSHPHTGNSLETTSHQVFPFMKHFWSTSSQDVTIF